MLITLMNIIISNPSGVYCNSLSIAKSCGVVFIRNERDDSELGCHHCSSSDIRYHLCSCAAVQHLTYPYFNDFITNCNMLLLMLLHAVEIHKVSSQPITAFMSLKYDQLRYYIYRISHDCTLIYRKTYSSSLSSPSPRSCRVVFIAKSSSNKLLLRPVAGEQISSSSR